MNDYLNVIYLQGDVTVHREMNQAELAALCVEDGVFLISVNGQGTVHFRKKKGKAVSFPRNSSNDYISVI